MKKLLVVVALALGVSSVSHAGILIEPYLGYEMGTTKNPSGKFEGSQLGLRLAYSAPLFFWGGLDYTTGTGTSKPEGGVNEDGKRSTLYGVVGVDFPILVRAWIAQSISNEMKFDTTGKTKGKATKLGVGFTGLPFVSLNLEYLMEKMDEGDSGTIDPAVENNAYVLSLSLPLDL